ncbi:MAG: C40 family peptidase [candidate division Zixibacteria bacterium]|nr:C40 family peptidase [candidate division Zixibacteria bacterium]
MSYKINVGIADIWSKPEFNSERISQALFNETIEEIKKVEEYSLVRLKDGYEGYIRNSFYYDESLQEADDNIVSASIAVAYIGADQRAPTAAILPFTSTIKVKRLAGEFAVCESARYGDIYIVSDDIVPLNQTPKLTPDMMSVFLDSAKRFIGVPYLWGGKSFFGFDCSGFVQTNFKFFGIDLPRDTKDQINVGREISRDKIKPGDLLFAENHVSIALNDRKYIHSSLSQGGVYINSLDSSEPNYFKELDVDLKTIRRIIES